MPTELTEAERAALKVIERSPDDLVSDEELARAVVSAVRSLIETDALNRHANRLDNFPSVSAALSDAYWYRDGLRDAAAIARDEAAAILNNP